MNRRNFIIMGGIATGAVIVPPSLYFLAPEVKDFAKAILSKELHYLKLEPSGVDNFINDYFSATGNDTISTVKWKALYYLNSGWEKSDRISNLMKYYLLSSDFFINKTDESKVVHYLGLFNSYKSPVPNPYSFVLYPPNQIREV